MKGFFKNYGDALLHILGAIAIMAIGWWREYLFYSLLFNTALWPGRELWQKRHALRDFFRLHVFIEWFPAVLIGATIYGVLKWTTIVNLNSGYVEQLVSKS